MGYEDKKKKFQKSHQDNKVLQYSKTPITEAFVKYSEELNSKQDKFERIVKLSRDVTIASKRAIFSLHALMRSGNYEEDLEKITETLKTVRNTHLKNIALELVDIDPYQFTRAYTPGLQEYIEAITFYHFLTQGRLFNLEVIREELTFKEDEMDQGDSSKESLTLLVPLLDYILGIQDLTGEIMRHCINSFSAHNMLVGYNDCNFVKNLYTGMLVLNLYRNGVGQGFQGKEFSKKLNVSLQSLKKMEMSYYATHIRGSEARDFRISQDDPLSEFDSYSFRD